MKFEEFTKAVKATFDTWMDDKELDLLENFGLELLQKHMLEAVACILEAESLVVLTKEELDSIRFKAYTDGFEDD